MLYGGGSVVIHPSTTNMGGTVLMGTEIFLIQEGNRVVVHPKRKIRIGLFINKQILTADRLPAHYPILPERHHLPAN